MASQIKQYKAELNDQVSKEIMSIRVPHTRATSDCAMNIISKIGGINRFDMHAACVLHDIAKELSYETMVKIIINAKDNPLLTEVIGDISIAEYESPKWLHGIVGAIVAHDIYGIRSKDVLKAIRYHKVGNINDPLFTKVLITADVANELRRARYMITAYTMLKMHKFEIERVYSNIIKYDTAVAITQEDVVIPRMLEGTMFKVNKLNTCHALYRLGNYYMEDAEHVWVPVYVNSEWSVAHADGVYVTPDGFENAMVVMDCITHDVKPKIIVTLSDKDWSSYMISYINDDRKNEHIIIPFSDAVDSGCKVRRGYYPKTPTRYLSIDSGDFQ